MTVTQSEQESLSMFKRTHAKAKDEAEFVDISERLAPYGALDEEPGRGRVASDSHAVDRTR